MGLAGQVSCGAGDKVFQKNAIGFTERIDLVAVDVEYGDGFSVPQYRHDDFTVTSLSIVGGSVRASIAHGEYATRPPSGLISLCIVGIPDTG